MPHLPLSEQAQIDWGVPWLAHIADKAEMARSGDLIAAFNHAIAGKNYLTGEGRALHFIPQDDLPEGTAYEAHIAATGGVPTRLNLHDFFNACIWLTFPLAKAALNARQAQQLSVLGVQHTRGVARDALTLFDENAAILVVSNHDIGTALREFNWAEALLEPRTEWDNPFHQRSDARAILYTFGHALMEKLTAPRKAICAHTWVVEVEDAWFAQPFAERLSTLDATLAQQIQDWQGNPRDFCPLPVLGVPHFWADNADKTFYNDARVFRSGRLRLAASI